MCPMTTILMCRPTHFDVSYQINPWMDPSAGAKAEIAVAEWQKLYEKYLELGYDIELIDQVEGLPDMVYAANGGFTLDGKAYGAKFAFPERVDEGPAYMDWFDAHGFEVFEPKHVNEGEGDMLMAGETILAGWGLRSTIESHDELRRIFDREVLSLRLVDPRFYHLDTALTVLEGAEGQDGPNVAFLREAFDEPSLKLLDQRFPDAIHASAADAEVLGLNMFGTGGDLVVSDRLTDLDRQLEDAGYRTHAVGLPELLKGGGSIKCCTLLLRR
ncbi:dimethylargininase [Helcobacillus sp. ACRRO]|uniref:dimethylargininase n=1 Tax=Helcobacillus sp. ACRRO TaxID=2918202 RepID=UPI0031B860F6